MYTVYYRCTILLKTIYGCICNSQKDADGSVQLGTRLGVAMAPIQRVWKLVKIPFDDCEILHHLRWMKFIIFILVYC
jgi:hypothetical protein